MSDRPLPPRQPQDRRPWEPTGRGLGNEVRLVQNPAIGAFLLWRFVCAYTAEGGSAPYPNVLLLFLVLPMTQHAETRKLITSTLKGSGLRVFVAKFSASEQKKSDLLYAIHPRVQALRSLSLASMRVAVASNLLAIDWENGLVYAVDNTYPKSATPESIAPLIRASERLAAWCAQLTFAEVASSLKVEF